MSHRARPTTVLIRGRQEAAEAARGEGKVMMEAELGVMCFADGGRGKDHWKLKKAALKTSP